jgi:LuxR family maltose regulon positive regulatory protein
MARHAIPRVIDDHLQSPISANASFTPIQVGSETWYAWLNEPEPRSFAFSSTQGTLTARREERHSTWYWYAYRSRGGHLRKVYLGKSEELTLERLHEAAALLSPDSTTNPRQIGTLSTSQTPATPVRSSPVSMPSLHLLTTKISVPPLRLNVVTRPRLTERLNAAMKGQLALIVAPAGWGKTTLLSAWHSETSFSTLPLAWVSLDAGDNDLTRFWTYVLAALDTLHPGVDETPLALLYASSSPPIEDVLTSLLNALVQIPTETILVLDDYHLIEVQSIHDTLIYFIEHLPTNMHLVIASRADPLLPLARLRARGALTELRADNLRFTSEETTAFLTGVMELPLSAEEVAALEAHTEGWIAGLHLAALSMQGRDDVAGFIAAFTGSHRYVVDYLIEEVLLRQPEEVQDFLMQTCLLDRLSGPLCDAVRVRDDSLVRLAQVEHANLFLVSLDDERQWYRYHHLFAEVLRNRLQQQQPSVVPELHHRASRWYEQHELFDEAVTHALAVPDVERAARLIEKFAQLTNFPSQFQILLGWLNRLPDALVRTHPSLCIMHAITLMLTHQLEKSSDRLQDAERCLEMEMPAEQRSNILGQLAAFRSQLARLVGDYERCIPLAQRALELVPDTKEMSLALMLHASALGTAANAYLVDGNMTPETERVVETTLASVRAMGNIPTTVRSISNLARLQLLQGRLRSAAVTIEQAAQLAARHGGLQSSINGADYYFILGDLLCERNQLDSAEQQLVQGIGLVKETATADAEMITRGYMALARLQQARGKSTQVRETLDAFTVMSRQRGYAPALVAHGVAVQAQVELAQGNLAAAIRWAESSSVSISDELRYQREREYLTLVRVRIAQGRETPMGPFLPEVLVLLERLLEDAEAKMRMRSMLEVLLLRALALQAQGDHIRAVTSLGRALALAEPEGYIRLFVDEGIPMVTLLCMARQKKMALLYVETLLKASGELITEDLYRSSSNTSLLKEQLTTREREVLRLVVEGASNREIAEYLVLSVNTVKKHVYNICGKLGVQSRAQAIAKARTLDLLRE